MKVDKLETYHAKRDFDVTEEPSGAVRPPRDGRSFVVQKHDATRLHYDFRLELDGVLKSWAVPKGPSLSPKERRLAVMVEDHPVDYRDFEGTIPEGEYGGGPVIVWDRGEWEPIGDGRAGLAKGKLSFTLHGEKLRGAFTLVRIGRSAKKNDWLLMKKADDEARSGPDAEIVLREPASVLSGRTIEDVAAARAKLPPFAGRAPELATLVDEVPASSAGHEWVYEIKYDGYRILAWLDGGEVRLASRNGKEWTERFPGVAEALSRVRARTAIFDGELCYVRDDGSTDFQGLQNALGDARASASARLVYFVFDLLHFDGVDLEGEPLLARKDKLRTILAGEKPPLALGDHATGDGAAFFAEACKAGLEGIVAKRADSVYCAGKRTRDWLKVKCQKRQELVIVGFTPPKGSRAGLGALLLAARDRENAALRYAGKVGTGFTRRSLDELTARLQPLAVGAPADVPLDGAPRMRGATWVKPELVCEVRFTEWTRDGSLRHPTFEGLREDKPSRDVVRERAAAAHAETAPAKVTATTSKLTHAERIIDPKTGLTKGDLARYHAAVAERLLPYAAKRPLMLKRCPEGNAKPGACFIQKHAGRGLAADVREADAGGERVLYVTSAEEILSLVQFNAIELHGWGARLPKWDRPDWMIFDLDPDEGLPFGRVVEVARAVRQRLLAVKLPSFVKTTGGKGLHVVVPLTPRAGWDEVRAFASSFASGLAREAPEVLTATMSKARRARKVFIDHFRNARGATAILPYSPRARDGLPVATPVAWEDLDAVDPRELTIATVPKLLASGRADPWRDLLATKSTLPRARDAGAGAG